MPNKHLEHLEDSIFDGRRTALDAVKQAALCRKVSVKWDGAPAIVFGTNPENGKFFVGTKSVFNKVKVKINYTHEDIDKNHTGPVADILRLCLHHLPHISGIVQASIILGLVAAGHILPTLLIIGSLLLLIVILS